MRKLEAVVKEIQDEMGYLQRREMKMRDTNGAWKPLSASLIDLNRMLTCTTREHEYSSQELFDIDHDWNCRSGRLAGELP